MSIRILSGNIVWSMLNQFFARGSLTLAAILLAREFSRREFAAFGYFQLTVAMLATFSVLGLGTAASKLAAERTHATSASDEDALGMLWLGSVGLAIVVSLVILVLPSNWIDGELGLPRWLVAVGAFSVALQAVPNGAVLGLEEFRNSAFNSLAGALVVVAAAMAAVHWGAIAVAMYGIIAGSLLQALANTVLVARRIGVGRLLPRSSAPWPHAGRILTLVLPLAAASGIVTLGMWLVGRIILSSRAGHDGFALYAIGMQWFALAMFLPANMGSVFLPRLVRSRSGERDVRKFLRLAVYAALLASLAVAVAGAVFEPLLLKMYGEKYSQVHGLITAFLFAAVVTSPVTTLGNALLAHDYHWWRLSLFAAWFGVLIVSAWCLRDVAVFGGALAIAIAYGFVSLAMWILVRKRGIA